MSAFWKCDTMPIAWASFPSGATHRIDFGSKISKRVISERKRVVGRRLFGEDDDDDDDEAFDAQRRSFFSVQKVVVGVDVAVRRKKRVYALVALHDFEPFDDVDVESYDARLCTRTRPERFALSRQNISKNRTRPSSSVGRRSPFVVRKTDNDAFWGIFRGAPKFKSIIARRRVGPQLCRNNSDRIFEKPEHFSRCRTNTLSSFLPRPDLEKGPSARRLWTTSATSTFRPVSFGQNSFNAKTL